jgi:HSP20 family molecular chaperone IbpA
MSVLSKRESHSPFADLFDWLEGGGWPSVAEWRRFVPGVRIEEYRDGDRYVVRAEMPAIDPEKDVTITVQDGVLSLSGERREEVKDKSRSEFRYGSFSRQIVLPRGAREDAVTATYKDGVLEIAVPIVETGPEARSIPVMRRGT